MIKKLRITDYALRINPKSEIRQLNNKKGFTLIELIIVMAVTAIIATVSLANYRTGEKSRRVGLAIDGITSALTQAQAYALAGKQTTNALANCRQPQYYYVSFSYLDSYSIYARNNCGGTDDLIQTFQLPDKIRVKPAGLVVDGSGAAATLSIAIYPPFGQIRTLADDNPTCAATVPTYRYCPFITTSITIETTDGTINKTVGVDGVVGRIGQ